jgi:DNA-directed RNA polymerase specialized sigma24 family protein
LEAAAALGISESTVQRELRLAKAWLYRALSQPRGMNADQAASGG